MSTAVQMILSKYVNELEKIYGTYLIYVVLVLFTYIGTFFMLFGQKEQNPILKGIK